MQAERVGGDRMKKMIVVFATLFILGVAVVYDGTDTSAVTWHKSKETRTTKGGFVFYSYPSVFGNECWIYKIKKKKGNDSGGTLSFPSKINGNTVTKLGFDNESKPEDDEFDNNIFGNVVEEAHGVSGESVASGKIKKITFPKTVKEITNNAFSGFTALEKVKLPDRVRKVKVSLFYGCRNLRKVGLPQNMESIYVGAGYNMWLSSFAKCPKLSKITLSSKNKCFKVKNNMILSRNVEKLIFVAPAMKLAKIPNGVREIGEAALGDSKVQTVVIPKTVSSVARKAFSSKKIRKIELDKRNPYLGKDKNTIYKKSDKSLVIIMVDKKNQAIVSDKVKIIGEDVSVIGPKIKRVDLSKKLEKVIEEWMFWDDWGGIPKVYFHGKVPPAVTSKYAGYEYTAMPIFDEVYVPRGTKKAYEKWAKNRDGLEFTNLKEF